MLRFAKVFCALLTASPTLCVGAGPIAILGDSRVYTEPVLGAVHPAGRAMSTTRTALLDNYTTLLELDLLSPEGLGEAKVLILGLLDPNAALSVAEQTALYGFVRGGGSLVFIGDNHRFNVANRSVAQMFGITYCDNQSRAFAMERQVASHPVLDGPGGLVREIALSGNLDGYTGAICGLGKHGTAVLGAPSRTFVAVIEAEELGPGSGSAVFISDANWLLDAGLGTIEEADNLSLLQNIIAYSQWTCREDLDCDDSLFCNGAEACVKRACVSGARPCVTTVGCFEESKRCGQCLAAAQCQGHGVCGGQGACVDGRCVAEGSNCGSACEFCDFDRGECRWCILDLARDGLIGDADLAAFVACMGACYDEGSACAAANFDGDAQTCVGSGDLSGLIACLGLTCSECQLCAGAPPPNVAQAPQPEALIGSELVLIDQRTGESQTAGASKSGRAIQVEVWLEHGDTPLSNAYVGLEWDADRLSLESVTPGSSFESLFVAEAGEGARSLEVLGGADLDIFNHATSSRAKLASLRFGLKGSGSAELRLKDARPPYGLSIRGQFGLLPAKRLQKSKRVVQIGAIDGAPTLPLGPEELE